MRLDHVNIRTQRLDEMRKWYVEVIGLRDGWRPPFEFPGAWLYAGDVAAVHLVGVNARPIAGGEVALEHFALSADDQGAFEARLDAAGIPKDARPVPGTDLVQFHLRDPDGNHIHVDFKG